MSTNIEIEFKSLLTKDEYRKLYDFLKCGSINNIIQVNTYYDTTDYNLKQINSALRTRYKNNDIEMTLKTPLEVGLLETEQKLTLFEVDKLTSDFPNGPVKDKLIELNIDYNNLEVITSITTNRIEVLYKECLICLDESSYNGVIDYEIELETSNYNYGYTVFIDLLDSLSIPYNKALPKVARALKV